MPVTIEQRLKDLEEYAKEFITVGGFLPDSTIQFRPYIRNNRIIGLFVNVHQGKFRYGSTRRLSLGIKNPQKWIVDLNKAVEESLSHRPLSATYLALKPASSSQRRHTFGIDDEWSEKYPGCLVTIWRGTILQAVGPRVQLMILELLG